MKYVYGPVPSRRLGRSLGVDTIPQKTCNFSCVYCQLGRTTTYINERRDFFPRNDILQEIKERINIIGKDNIDYITFVGDGEPTLCKSLGWLLEQVKSSFQIPIAVITNGALLYLEEVQNELCFADIVLPTLDAGCPETFKKINRPHPTIDFNKMINGMIEFRKKYSGQIWIEFMAVRGINDNLEELNKIVKYYEQIKPDKVYINVPIRPPAENWVKVPTNEGLASIKQSFKNVVEINMPEIGDFQVIDENISELKKELSEIIKRHPMRLDQLKNLLKSKNIKAPEKVISELEELGIIKQVNYDGKIFFLSSKVKRAKD
ncbi:MAG: radical SAM protein [Candidatus Helarchaeota archaeon]